MAKNNKSLEEMLKEALLPIDELPYEVPANWAWTKIQFLGSVVTGSTPSKSNPEYYGEDFPLFKPTDLNQEYYVIDSNDKLSGIGLSKTRQIPEKSIMVTCIGATIGKTGFSRKMGATNQQINSIVVDSNFIAEYVYYGVISPYFQNSIIENASSTTLPILNKSRFEELHFPLAPLEEQHRIVNKIESLFSKIDKAKDLVEEAREGFENRRAVMLSKAFEGELTRKWREKNGIGLDSWKTVTLGQCVAFRKEKYDPASENISIPYVGLEHIEKSNGIIGIGSSEEVKSLKTVFSNGDILYGKLRPYLNKHDNVLFYKHH